MLDTPGPYLLDVMVPHIQHVLPMIPGGGSFKDIITKVGGSRGQCAVGSGLAGDWAGVQVHRMPERPLRRARAAAGMRLTLPAPSPPAYQYPSHTHTLPPPTPPQGDGTDKYQV